MRIKNWKGPLLIAGLTVSFIGCQSDENSSLASDGKSAKIEPLLIYDLASSPKKLVVDINVPSLYKSIVENIKSEGISGKLERFYATYDSATGKIKPEISDQLPSVPLAKAASGTIGYTLYAVNNNWPEWGAYGGDSSVAGTTGQSLPVYALRVWEGNGHFFFQTHHAQWGWLPKVSNGQTSGCSQANVNCEILSGTPTSALKYMQAFKIWFDPDFYNYGVIRYEAHVAGLGWMGTVVSPGIAGTVGQSRTLQAIRIWHYSN